MTNRLSKTALLCVVLAGCGHDDASLSTVDAALDGMTGTPGDAREEPVPDAQEEPVPSDARADGSPEAGACLVDASTTVCCCAGDIGGTVVCEADGSIGCASSPFPGETFGVFYGDDCNAAKCGGPCSAPCAPDSGLPDAGNRDGGDASSGDAGDVDAGDDAGSNDASAAD